jgi:hypothetical protein
MHQVKYSQNKEYCQGQGQKGDEWTKVVSLMPEMECHQTGGIEDMVQILPRTNREGLARVPLHLSMIVSCVSVLEMASLLLQTSSTANLEYPRLQFDRHDCAAA